MQLIPMITEVQCNIVDDAKNINSRKAVFRLRINGTNAWLDMLQGKYFFKYLKENRDDFIAMLRSYNLDYVEANISNEMLLALKKLDFIILTVYKVKMLGLNTNYIKFAVA